MAPSLETLLSYVPSIVLADARRAAEQPAGLDRHDTHGAALFADISGFTPLTERLAVRGSAGAEELAELLNSYFRQLIDVIATCGGDVVRLAGDAVLALWPSPKEKLADAVRQATHCALDIQRTLKAPTGPLNAKIAVRIGIGAGDVSLLRIGGAKGRYHTTLCGPPIARACFAQTQVKPGEVGLSSEAWTIVAHAGIAAALGNGIFRLSEINAPGPVKLQSQVPSMVGPALAAAVRKYVPEPVLMQLASGQSHWSAELRRLTVLFVNLTGIDPERPAFLAELQNAMNVMQGVCERVGGMVKEVMIDDKGTTAILVFGLPAFTHEDDASRAVDAGLSLQVMLRESGVRAGIGMTTGSAFVGSLGNERRREYTVTGELMNVAARLMQLQAGEVFCDAETHRATAASFAFASLPAVSVRGKTALLAVYRPLHRTTAAKPIAPLFGREMERSLLARKLDALSAGRGGVVFIEGEPGIGKSRLVADLLEQSQARAFVTLIGRGNALEQRTAYHVWRAPIADLLGISTTGNPLERREKATASLAAAGLQPALVPLLDAPLQLDLGDNDITAQMEGEARAESTNQLIVQLVQQATAGAQRRLVLVLEDGHWFDSASWALARLIVQQVTTVLLVITMRSDAGPMSAACRDLQATQGAELIRLKALEAAQIEALIGNRLGATRLSDRVAMLIHKRAQGNPFFSEELAYALRDRRAIVVRDGVCELTSEFEGADDLGVPETVQGVVAARIDRLNPVQQLTLKVASVVGRIFAFRVLLDVYPVPDSKRELPAALSILEQINLTQLETPEPALSYLFRHAITHEVAYGMMTFGQRRQLHQTVAIWYERLKGDELASNYPVLAHHWRRAEDESKAIDYLEKAGQQALRTSAYKEAVEFFSEALTVAEGREQGQPPLRLARWERQLSEAHLGLGQLTESRAHMEKALALLGWPLPGSQGARLAQVALQTLRQVLHRLRPDMFIAKEEHAREMLAEASRTHIRLAEIHFYAHDKVGVLHSVLHALNLAEAVGSSPELARAYGGACYAAGSVPLHGLAERYGLLARTTALKVGDLSSRVWAYEITGLYDIGIGNWPRAQDSHTLAMSIARSLGDRRRADECFGLLLVAAHYQGDFARALGMSEESHMSAHKRGDAQFEIVGRIGQAENLLVQDRTREAIDILREAPALLVKAPDITQEMKVHVLCAIAHFRAGDLSHALECARAGFEMVERRPPMATHALGAYSGLAELYLSLWENGDAAYAKLAGRACAALRAFARTFPVGQPRSLLLDGNRLWMLGRKRRAVHAWSRSLDKAEHLGMPYEEGLAHLEIGRHLPLAAPKRREHLDRAADTLSRIGAAFDLDRAKVLARSELTGPPGDRQHETAAS